MIFGFASPKNHEKIYNTILNLQRLEGLPEFVPLMPSIQIDYFSSDWLSMMLVGIEP